MSQSIDFDFVTTTKSLTIGDCHCDCQSRWNAMQSWSEDLVEEDLDNGVSIDINPSLDRSKILFKCDQNINSKIILWNGCIESILKLNVDAIVHPTNQYFERNSNPFTNALYEYAGQELRKTLFNKIKYCPIGSIKITKGYSLDAYYIIHTAIPHYKCKYHTASETSLFNCYSHVLQAAKHYNIRTLAINNLALKEHNYPQIDGIHLGLRVIRRFLESYTDSFDTIVICIEDKDEFDLYRSILKLYFPRNLNEEQLQIERLPANNGGPMGEPIIPERAIRIKENPIKSLFYFDYKTDSGLDFDDSGDDCNCCLAHSYSSSYSNDGIIDNNDNNDQSIYGKSEMNIDECRERLIELKYQEEFDIGRSPIKHSKSFVSSLFNATNTNLDSNTNLYISNRYTEQQQYSSMSSMENMSSPSSPSFSSKFYRKNNHRKYNQSTAAATEGNNQQNLHHFDEYDLNDQLMLFEHQRQLKFERLSRKIRKQDKELCESMREMLAKCIYISSTNDHNHDDNESILIIDGHDLMKLFQNEMNGKYLDQIVIFFIKTLDKICRNGRKYSIFYFHANVIEHTFDINNDESNEQAPKLSQLLSRLNEYISYQHKSLLKAIHIINPTIFNRLYVWWLKTFQFKYLKTKFQFINNIQQLHTIISDEHLKNLPKMYDK